MKSRIVKLVCGLLLFALLGQLVACKEEGDSILPSVTISPHELKENYARASLLSIFTMTRERAQNSPSSEDREVWMEECQELYGPLFTEEGLGEAASGGALPLAYLPGAGCGIEALRVVSLKLQSETTRSETYAFVVEILVDRDGTEDISKQVSGSVRVVEIDGECKVSHLTSDIGKCFKE